MKLGEIHAAVARRVEYAEGCMALDCVQQVDHEGRECCAGDEAAAGLGAAVVFERSHHSVYARRKMLQKMTAGSTVAKFGGVLDCIRPCDVLVLLLHPVQQLGLAHVAVAVDVEFAPF